MITVYNLNCIDDNYFNDKNRYNEINKICVETQKHFAEKNGFEYRLYDFNSQIVKEAKEYCKEVLDKATSPATYTDLIRLYIESKYLNHLYFDDDIFVFEDFKINDDYSIGDNFCYLWNYDNFEPFQKLLDFEIGVLKNHEKYNSIRADIITNPKKYNKCRIDRLAKYQILCDSCCLEFYNALYPDVRHNKYSGFIHVGRCEEKISFDDDYIYFHHTGDFKPLRIIENDSFNFSFVERIAVKESSIKRIMEMNKKLSICL